MLGSGQGFRSPQSEKAEKINASNEWRLGRARFQDSQELVYVSEENRSKL